MEACLFFCRAVFALLLSWWCVLLSLDIGAAVAKHFPKHSQDLNAVENVWAHLRARLNETKPTRRELRVAFIARLRRAVVWLNRTHRRALLALGSNQRKRAREVIENGGHRTSW